jgi:hypothetical protein
MNQVLGQIDREALAKFPRGVLTLPLPVRIWLGVLLFVNAVMPLFFLGNREAQVTLLIFVLSVGFMMALTHVVGFNRLLGVGHILWVPLLLYLWSRMGGHPAVEPYGAWIRIVMLLNAAALVVDGWDVVRYVRGERGEIMASEQ